MDGKQEPPQLKIDIGANRYDLLCFEGIVLNLRTFMGLPGGIPQYKLSSLLEKDLQVATVDESVGCAL